MVARTRQSAAVCMCVSSFLDSHPVSAQPAHTRDQVPPTPPRSGPPTSPSPPQLHPHFLLVLRPRRPPPLTQPSRRRTCLHPPCPPRASRILREPRLATTMSKCVRSPPSRCARRRGARRPARPDATGSLPVAAAARRRRRTRAGPRGDASDRGEAEGVDGPPRRPRARSAARRGRRDPPAFSRARSRVAASSRSVPRRPAEKAAPSASSVASTVGSPKPTGGSASSGSAAPEAPVAARKRPVATVQETPSQIQAGITRQLRVASDYECLFAYIGIVGMIVQVRQPLPAAPVRPDARPSATTRGRETVPRSPHNGPRQSPPDGSAPIHRRTRSRGTRTRR